MTQKKKVLIIGIDPFIIDFTSPEFAAFPGLTAQKVEAGIKGAINQLAETGYDAELCWTDFGNTASTTVKNKLMQQNYDIVLIGAGIRIPPNNFFFFEKLVNTIHEFAPKARFCFNTNPTDTIEAVKRWI
jgi:hypothetical protein